MLERLKLSTKGIVLTAIPLGFELLLLSALTLMLHQTEQEVQAEAKAKQMLKSIHLMAVDVAVCVGASADMAMNPRPESMASFNTSESEVNRLLGQLEVMSQDDATIHTKIVEWQQLMTTHFGKVRDAIMEAQSGDRLSSLQKLQKLRPFIREANQRLSEITHLEDDILDASEKALETNREVFKVLIAAGSALNIVIAISMTMFFNRSLTQRLAILVENTRRLGGSTALLPRLTGADEISNLDEVFHEMAADLEESNRKRKELVEIVAHDLRSPLMSIQTTLTLIEENAYGPVDTSIMEAMKKSSGNVDRLIQLINNLLSLEKLEGGSVSMAKKKVSLSWLVESALDSLEGSIKAKNIVTDYPDEAPMILVDDVRMLQVIVNLLGNALKYSPEGGTVKIDYVHSPEFIEVTVTDQGPGIAKDKLDTVFDKYVQAKLEDEERGSGLGLAISKAIVLAHGGTIGVRSEEGKGSTFWLRLPV
jgi:signal transduction histidine kinase